jgi:hypothetical protein
MLKAVDDGHTSPLSALGFTRSKDLHGITFVLNDNIRLPGRGDSHTMIRGHPNNVESPVLGHTGEFARAFTDGEGFSLDSFHWIGIVA